MMPNREKFIQLYSRVNIYSHAHPHPYMCVYACWYVRVACVLCTCMSVGILAHPFEINESNSLRFYESMDKLGGLLHTATATAAVADAC